MDSKMKKNLLLMVVVWVWAIAYPQAKKPTLMVVPSDYYCQQHGYYMSSVVDGKTERYPDYQKALQNDFELNTAITVMGQIMADRGFPLKLLEQEIKTINEQDAEDEMLTSKSGGEIAETPYDRLKKKAKCDIILQLGWKINHFGPRYSLTFNLQGIDAYTNKQIVACQGTGEPTYSAELPILIEESVVNNLETFNYQLQNHFNDMMANGREVSVNIKRWDNAPFDLETEFGDRELGEIIEDWMADNTVSGRFNTVDATENMLVFQQVRIPLYDERGRANDTRRWSRGLVNMLKGLGITSKLTTKGLGQASIIIGGK